jgi:membrane fusion protein (multidrug efflux system)
MMLIFVIFASIATILFALLALYFFRRSKRLVLGSVFAVLSLFFALADLKGFQFHKMTSMKPPMPVETVTSAVAKEEDWAPVLSSVGSISAVQGAVVSTELGGMVSEIGFQNDTLAKKGDLLVKLDASQEEALLRSSEAEVELARTDLERTRDLAAKKVVSSSELDAAESKFRRLTAVVDQMRSNIRKKAVVAPFDGQLGIRQVNVGQMINSGQPVVPLQSLDPVFADFALPQQYFSKLSQGLEIRVTTDAVPGRVFTGKLTAVNSMIDVATRNVGVQATLANPDHVLRPGMFAKVEVVLPEKGRALVIPGSAISYAPYGDSVFIIEKQKDPKTGKESQVLRQQFVRVGEARGDFVSITNGLKAGETIVGAGVFKLRNGIAVTINNDLAPKPQVNPTPADS